MQTNPTFPARAQVVKSLLPDSSSYWGRVMYFYEVAIDPRIWYSSSGQLMKCLKLIEGYELGEVEPSVADLRMARKRVEASINSSVYRYAKCCSGGASAEEVSHSMIPLPFRFSSFLPMNTIIAYTLLFEPRIPVLGTRFPSLNTATGKVLFWNLYNRLYCVSLDWFNRNTSANIERMSERSGKQLTDCQKLEYYRGDGKWESKRQYMLSFAGATAAAWTFATVGKQISNKMVSFAQSPRVMVHRLVSLSALVASTYLSPAMALSAAHVFDLGWTRYEEWRSGITLMDANGDTVTDEDGKPLRSTAAGWKAVCQVGAQRILTANIVLLVPSVGMVLLRNNRHFQRATTRFPRLKMGLQLALCVLTLGAAVPLTQAIYPKYGAIYEDQLEDSFRNTRAPIAWVRGTDRPRRHLVFDRGL